MVICQCSLPVSNQNITKFLSISPVQNWFPWFPWFPRLRRHLPAEMMESLLSSGLFGEIYRELREPCFISQAFRFM